MHSERSHFDQTFSKFLFFSKGNIGYLQNLQSELSCLKASEAATFNSLKHHVSRWHLLPRPLHTQQAVAYQDFGKEPLPTCLTLPAGPLFDVLIQNCSVGCL